MAFSSKIIHDLTDAIVIDYRLMDDSGLDYIITIGSPPAAG